jgi:cation diffusion facilitator family transporter
MFLLNIKSSSFPHNHKENPHPQSHVADYNLQSAYLHVLADAFASVLTIVALLTAKYFGLIWMDPLMGIIGAILVSRWSMGLLKQTSNVLLDKEAPKYLLEKIKKNIESDGDSRITDLHIWSVGPNRYSANISVVAQNPLEPEQYKQLLSSNSELAHITVEVFRCKIKHY